MQAKYRRLKTRLVPFLRVAVWTAADHLLFIRNRFFDEQYTRLYWADIQAILLYPLRPPGILLLVAEILCVVLIVGTAPLANHLWGAAFAVVFAVWYGFWRLIQPAWACEISTKTSSVRFPLSPSLHQSRHVLNHLRSHTTTESQTEPRPPGSGRVALHIAAFAMGAISPVGTALSILYYLLLGLAFFFQQRFDFPFFVRSAAVMSQIFAILQLALWILSRQLLPGLFSQFNHWEFQVGRAVISLYGLWASIKSVRSK